MQFTHIANPVRVTANVIRDVIMDQGGNYNLTLDNGREYQAGLTMTSRHVPQTGDYLVRQEDGYEYLNPKDVFEKKYRAIGATLGDTVANQTAAYGQIGSDTNDAEKTRYIRQQALHMAIACRDTHDDNEHIIATAAAFEKYLAG